MGPVWRRTKANLYTKVYVYHTKHYLGQAGGKRPSPLVIRPRQDLTLFSTHSLVDRRSKTCCLQVVPARPPEIGTAGPHLHPMQKTRQMQLAREREKICRGSAYCRKAAQGESLVPLQRPCASMAHSSTSKGHLSAPRPRNVASRPESFEAVLCWLGRAYWRHGALPQERKHGLFREERHLLMFATTSTMRSAGTP